MPAASREPRGAGGAPRSARVCKKLYGGKYEHMAASVGNLYWLQECLQKAESPNQADINGFSAIHLAALHGRLECLKLVVEKFEVDVNLASLTGWTPIHLVMNKESGPRALACLQYLIGKGADINIQNQGGTSPLHKAASEGRLNCIIELVKAGADVHAKDAEGQQPIDLCRIWAHRSCARFLTDAMWKIDKRNFAREMHKLNQLKSKCQRSEQNFWKIEKREQDLLNTVAFSNWLRLKQQQQLPDSAKRMHLPEDRAKLDAVPKKEVAKIPPGEKKISVQAKRGAPVKGEPAQPPTTKSQRAWNGSVNPSSPLVTNIFRPTTIRLGTNPEACGDHDFSSFLFLSKDSHGQPVIEMAYDGRLSPVPHLPYEVIERSLFPHARPSRVTMPQGFKPTHIFDVKRKRLPSLEHRWTDEMAVSLRETLDPAFRATLKDHLSAINHSS
ncbi:ankyrin repeat domain-containing protein 53-like [Mauremys mutica]|uniref:ankyrin repeat domain-containing protein 53-like n=1 Tax=Mauremys mutica TaxID=74926 RepID=UPI001D169D46|nr:ankyrin repeat domain-containing protein 53-like [Mauremys mutica]